MLLLRALFMVLVCHGLVVADSLFVPADYETIQDAIDDADDGDEIFVAAGTYEENIDFLGKSIELISEDGPEETIIDGGGNGTVVLFENGEDEDAVLDGFTICNGGGVYWGAGILIDESSPTIRNNIIEKNKAGISSIGAGGGFYIALSEAVIIDNVIRDNEAVSTADPPISVGVGGGIYIESAVCSTTCSNAPLLEGNVIVGNTATDSGGGVYIWMEAAPTLLGNIIANNESGRFGGGVSIVRTENAVLDRNTIYGNVAETNGGISAEDLSDDCSVVGCGPGPSTLRNCIVWGNSADENDQLPDGELDIEYCIVEGGVDGDTNLDDDPLLVAPDAGDFSVEADSPAIDAGDPDSDDDPDGTQADIGAQPYVDRIDIDGTFRRGDVDGNGEVAGLIDALRLLVWAFSDGEEPPCAAAADVDGNGAVSALADALFLLNWTFSGGDEPSDPGPEDCGPDPNELACETPPDC